MSGDHLHLRYTDPTGGEDDTCSCGRWVSPSGLEHDELAVAHAAHVARMEATR